MSKGVKILILVVLWLASSSLFAMARNGGHAQAAAFFAFVSVGLLIAIPVVALSRRR